MNFGYDVVAAYDVAQYSFNQVQEHPEYLDYIVKSILNLVDGVIGRYIQAPDEVLEFYEYIELAKMKYNDGFDEQPYFSKLMDILTKLDMVLSVEEVYVNMYSDIADILNAFREVVITEFPECACRFDVLKAKEV